MGEIVNYFFQPLFHNSEDHSMAGQDISSDGMSANVRIPG